jgi:hypothetical protein
VRPLAGGNTGTVELCLSFGIGDGHTHSED